MSLDLTKLTPAPWLYDERIRSAAIYHGEPVNCFSVHRDDFLFYREWGGDDGPDPKAAADWAFIVLARNAFDVMMRRGWSPEFCNDADQRSRWRVRQSPEDKSSASQHGNVFFWRYPDPFTALVEADRWYKANVEKGGAL